jgi:hypothetical protein
MFYIDNYTNTMLQNARRNIPSFLTDANHRQLGKGIVATWPKTQE